MAYEMRRRANTSTKRELPLVSYPHGSREAEEEENEEQRRNRGSDDCHGNWFPSLKKLPLLTSLSSLPCTFFRFAPLWSFDRWRNPQEPWWRNLQVLDLSGPFQPRLRLLDLLQMPFLRYLIPHDAHAPDIRIGYAPFDGENGLTEFTTETLEQMEEEEESQTIFNQNLGSGPLTGFAPAERFDELENEIVELGDEVAIESSRRVQEMSSVVDRCRACGKYNDKEEIIEHRISIGPIVDMPRPDAHGKRFKSWLFVIINLSLEILALAFDQVSSPTKSGFALVGMLMSLVAVAVCLIELGLKAQTAKVTVRRWGWIWWFYYPSPRDRRFGTFADIFGLICAILELISSAIQFGFFHQHVDNPIKISLFPVIFATCVTVSRFIGNPNELPHERPD